MEKRAIAKLAVTGLLMLLSAISKSFAADSVEEQIGTKVAGGVTFVMQGTTKDTTAKADDGSITGIYVFDLRLTKEFENNGKLVVCFKDGNGHGLTKTVQTYAVVNAAVYDQKNTNITELFYQQSFFNNKFTVNCGKLNFGAYFAENKYAKSAKSQFITSIFTADKIVESPPQHVAISLNYVLNENFDFSYAYFTRGLYHIDANGFNIVQAAYRTFISGNYLAYAWTNNQNHYSCENLNDKSGNRGFGISADQEVNKVIVVFGRVSYKVSSVTTLKVSSGTVTKDNLNLPLSLSWDTGIQLKGAAWSRTNDAIGFAIGQMYGSSDYQKYINPNYKSGAETEFELYYKFEFNKYITISPAVQYFINPQGGNADNKGNIFVYGVRFRMDF